MDKESGATPRPTYEELVEVLDDMISMGAAYTHLMPDRRGHNRARVDKAEALLSRCRTGEGKNG